LEKKAKASGASKLVVKDLREEFVRDYVFPCVRAGAIYERKYLLGTSMARPVIAKVSSYLEVCYIVVVFMYSNVDFQGTLIITVWSSHRSELAFPLVCSCCHSLFLIRVDFRSFIRTFL
jgi:hypothetical protein